MYALPISKIPNYSLRCMNKGGQMDNWPKRDVWIVDVKGPKLLVKVGPLSTQRSAWGCNLSSKKANTNNCALINLSHLDVLKSFKWNVVMLKWFQPFKDQIYVRTVLAVFTLAALWLPLVTLRDTHWLKLWTPQPQPRPDHHFKFTFEIYGAV